MFPAPNIIFFFSSWKNIDDTYTESKIVCFFFAIYFVKKAGKLFSFSYFYLLYDDTDDKG